MVYCRECSEEIHDSAKTCPSCGAIQIVTFPKDTSMSGATVHCRACSATLHKSAKVCPTCGAIQVPVNAKDKTVAGLLAIFLGGFGVHRFYLGQWWGVFYLLFFWTVVPFIIAFVEGISYLMMKDHIWNEKYS